MRRAEKSIVKLTRYFVVAAALLAGNAASSSQGATTAVLEGSQPILDACLAAETALESADSLLQARDPECIVAISDARTKVLEARTAVRSAVWPSDLVKERRSVRRWLAAADMRLARMLQRNSLLSRWAMRAPAPPAARRTSRNNWLTRTGKSLNSAQQNVTQSAAVVQQVAPPAPPAPPVSNQNPTPPAPVPPPTSTDFAWTNLAPSADTRVVYVSTSSGSDSNDGLSATSTGNGHGPKKTLTSGTGSGACAVLRNGYPDWLLLKRGDTWHYADIGSGYGGPEINWGQKSGRSASEPLVYSTYGDPTQPRPKVLDSQLIIGGSHVVVEGLDLEHAGESASASGTGILQYTGGTADLLIENCYVSGFGANLLITPDGGDLKNFQLRGCVIVGAQGQGLLMGHVDTWTIEGNVFDLNGWNGVNNSSQYNHNVYLSETNITGGIFRNNISARSSSHGCHMRTGGTCEDNLFLQNPVGLNFGQGAVNWPTQKASGTVRRNVFLDGRDLDDLGGRGYGMFLEQVSGVEVYDNVLSHEVTGSTAVAFSIGYHAENLAIHDNITYLWDTPGAHVFAVDDIPDATITVTNNVFRQASGLFVQHTDAIGHHTFSGNRYYTATGNSSQLFYLNGANYSASGWSGASGENNAVFTDATYPHPERDIGSYAASLGLSGNLSAFMTEARKQSRSYWRPEFTAKTVNAYISAGFGK